MRSAFPLLLGLLLVLSGCSTSNEVIGRGPIQKRKFRPGWHVDFGNRTPDRPARVRSVHEPSPIAVHTPWSDRSVEPQLLASRSTAKMEPPPKAPVWSGKSRPAFTAQVIVQAADGTTIALEEATPNANERRWNFMAIVSGIFLVLSAIAISLGGGGIIAYLLTFSVLTGIIGLLLCIKYKERGKGIAIAAILGPVLLLALVVAALNAAW